MAVESADEPAKVEKLVERPSVSKPPTSSAEKEIRAVACKFADHPILNPDPGVWAVLTAISKNARQRPQGMNIILNGDEHRIGRLPVHKHFQIAVMQVSANHCRIYRERVAVGDSELEPDSPVPTFLKDSSTNGTYLNWTRLSKTSPEARLLHGDIISFVAPPHDENAFAFVYREVRNPGSSINGAVLKRKTGNIGELGSESKRLKGIGIGAPEGPVSLDDVRSLQRSNTELRKQLESHVLTIETMRIEARASVVRHEKELKELKASTSNSYLDQIKELQQMLNVKQKKIDEVSSLSAECRHSVKDLSEKLSASMQSRVDADEVINSQKVTISELEAQLGEERNQRRREREKAEANLKSALQRAHSEAQEETKRQADIYSRQHKEQQEVICKLQESEKESRMFVETLRSKLEDTRESLVISEKKVRQLEAQVQEEQLTSGNNKKRVETLESEVKRLRKDLESEKVAREEAWAKVSALELEIASAVHELSIEKQRFQGARERIILRETQLRAFYSTTEEISSLFAKQQEQLKAMQKTLEDEENYDKTSNLIDFNVNPIGNRIKSLGQKGETEGHQREVSPAAISPFNIETLNFSSSDEDASDTEKHDCHTRSQEDHAQDLECTSTHKGFGSDIDGVGTEPIPGGIPNDTERVLETESPGGVVGLDNQNAALHKCSNFAGDTMQLDEAQGEGNMEKTGKREGGGDDQCSQSRLEDTGVGLIRTDDLLASEVPGSWANSTGPSFHGENDDCNDVEADAAAGLLCMSDVQASCSQSNIAVSDVGRLSEEHRALNAMIEIVAPDFKEQFQSGGGKNESTSDAETEEGSDQSGGDESGGGDEDSVDSVGEGDDVMIDDSVG